MALLCTGAPVGASAQTETSGPTAPLNETAQELLLNIEDARLTMAQRRAENELSNQAVAQQLEFNRKLYWHKVLAYYLQLALTVVLTGVGIAILFSALKLSHDQFKLDATRGAEGASNSFKWTGSGLELSSSVIGLFVLLAAMAFFYVYIKEVYRLTDPNAEAPPSQHSAAPEPKPAEAPPAPQGG